jgi:hypothetical protein
MTFNFVISAYKTVNGVNGPLVILDSVKVRLSKLKTDLQNAEAVLF